MTRAGVNRASFLVPLILSGAALAIVLGNIAAGVRPQPDENTSAHLWQLLMAAQVPVIFAFIATADWRTRSSAGLLAIQLAAFASACIPVWLAGY
ncbi:MAG TPA: hypothetical protein VGU01_08610 [Sphingomicrobium sp.]|nr:hypothetical protein [Sphingomicrobium sp.]